MDEELVVSERQEGRGAGCEARKGLPRRGNLQAPVELEEPDHDEKEERESAYLLERTSTAEGGGRFKLHLQAQSQQNIQEMIFSNAYLLISSGLGFRGISSVQSGIFALCLSA